MGDGKIRVYIGSLVAFKQIGEPGPDMQSYVENKPIALMADDIENAALQAKHFVYKQWPKEEGWKHHTAVMVPATKDFFLVLNKMALEGHVSPDIPGEGERTFFFDESDERNTIQQNFTDVH